MIRDISIVVRPGTPAWPGDTPFSCRWTWEIAGGASVNVSSMTSSPHVGTHADAPLHVRDGWRASHELPLDAFLGPAVVVDVSGLPGPISLDALDARAKLRQVERLLLHTGRTIALGAFPESWPVLSEECVAGLLARGLRLVGVDCPSVDGRESKTLAVHRRLFEGGAQVVENLDLRGVPAGRYELLALPLRVEGLDAAPVRALLREEGREGGREEGGRK